MTTPFAAETRKRQSTVGSLADYEAKGVVGAGSITETLDQGPAAAALRLGTVGRQTILDGKVLRFNLQKQGPDREARQDAILCVKSPLTSLILAEHSSGSLPVGLEAESQRRPPFE